MYLTTYLHIYIYIYLFIYITIYVYMCGSSSWYFWSFGQQGQPNLTPLSHLRFCSLRSAQETFIQEVEVIRQEMEETEVVIDGEYVDKQTLLETWGWTETLGPH